MKSLKTFLFVSSFLALVLTSCTKDEKKDYLIGGFAPSLTASSTDTIPLSFAQKDEVGLKLTWTNPNYKFTTGPSSQDVNYLIEIDTTGSNFTNPARQTVAVSKDLSKSFIQSEFNDYLLNQLVLVPGMRHNIEIRVKAALGATSAAPLLSNVLKFKVTPYSIPPKVEPPASGKLFLVGDATPGGWSNPVPVPSQVFVQKSPTLYEITVPLIGGKEYLFLPVNGDWSHKYAVADKTVSGLSAGGDFKKDAKDNFPGPAANGTYKITVDFQRGKFTVNPI